MLKMPANTPTFVFDDDGRAYAYLAGKIVAAGDDADVLEAQLHQAGENPFAKSDDDDGGKKENPFAKKDGENPFAKKEDKGKDDGDKDDDDDEDGKSGDKKENPFAKATHVITPNGLKGTILGKQRGLWGDQVTIRLENGRIAKFDVTSDSDMKYTKEAAVAPSEHTFIADLQVRLDQMPDGTKTSLVARAAELRTIKHDGSAFIRSASYSDGSTVDNIIVQADYELREVTDALSALEDAEPFEAPAPFSTGVQEQEAMGGGDSSWLDHAVEQMVTENESQDFDTLLEEGPDTFVAEQETAVLEDAGVTNEYADQFVSSKTAGLDANAVADFKAAFLANVDQARKVELESRKEAVEKIAKEASAEDHDGDAEGLFW